MGRKKSDLDEVWEEEESVEIEDLPEEPDPEPDPEPEQEPEPDPKPVEISKGNPRVGGRYVLDQHGNRVKVE